MRSRSRIVGGSVDSGSGQSRCVSIPTIRTPSKVTGRSRERRTGSAPSTASPTPSSSPHRSDPVGGQTTERPGNLRRLRARRQLRPVADVHSWRLADQGVDRVQAAGVGLHRLDRVQLQLRHRLGRAQRPVRQPHQGLPRPRLRRPSGGLRRTRICAMSRTAMTSTRSASGSSRSTPISAVSCFRMTRLGVRFFGNRDGNRFQYNLACLSPA